jgi:hypothetical protein
MIVVKVELHSAVTGRTTELARAIIHNVGGNTTYGNYEAFTCRGRSAADLSRSMKAIFTGEQQAVHRGKVENHPRLSQHVWNLVAKSLTAMGYGK